MMMTADFFGVNRERTIQATKQGLIILSAYSKLQRSNDAAFSFDQEANFWWLTGINEPEWWVIIDGQQGKSWLVAPIVSDIHATFDGSLSHADAREISGIETIISNAEAAELLRDLSQSHEVAYSLNDHPYIEHFDFIVNPAQKKTWHMLEAIFPKVDDVRLELAKLRAIKQPEEIEAIRKAIALTNDAFEVVKKKLPSLKHEYEVEAEFSYYFRLHGAQGHAYDPIVAGGKNACTLHYGHNSEALHDASLLLLDIGARVDGYAADITRTYAVGEPTKRQQEVHTAVQAAHEKIIALLKPHVSVVTYHEKVDEIMKSALVSLDLMKSDDDYRRYFPHAVSHGLGVDVHDSLGKPTVFLPGMVLTVEPGIYIPEEGIGVRIENDILITETGHENLSQKLSTSL